MNNETKFSYNFSIAIYPGYFEIACPHKDHCGEIAVRPADWNKTVGRFVDAAASSEPGDPVCKVSKAVLEREDELQAKILNLQLSPTITLDGDSYRVFDRSDVEGALELAAKILSHIHEGEAGKEEKEFLQPAIDASRFLGPFKRLLNAFHLASFQPEPFVELPPIPKGGYYLPPPC